MNSRWIVGVIIAFLFLALPAGAYLYFTYNKTENTALSVALENAGYVQFEPPSKLVPPGTWVTINSNDPFRLGIICTLKSALGMDEKSLLSSVSADTKMNQTLSGKFGVGAEFLRSLRADQKLSSLSDLEVTLSNIRLLEVSDEMVVTGLKSRSADCQSAIKSRLNANQPLTMIKSALVADVIYKASFSGELEETAKSDLRRELGLSLDLKVSASGAKSVTLVGKDLIWGVRDDSFLAKSGIGLPATGAANAKRESILKNHGPVKDVSGEEQVRKSFSKDFERVEYAVEPIRQKGSQDCWATVYAMLKSWKDKRRWSVPAAVADLGGPYPALYLNNSGLPGGTELDFVRSAGMRAEPPAAYHLEGWVSMLREFGPLWLIVGDGFNSHAWLLVGIYGPKFENETAAYESAVFEYIDPQYGTYHYKPALDFMTEFESEAAWIVDSKQFDQNLRWQILHF